MLRSSALLSFAFSGLSVAAQLLSDSCQTALGGIVTNQDTANCLNPSALIPIALNGGNVSIVQPIDNWLTGLCPQASCSNSTLETASRNIVAGCHAEFLSFGLDSNDPLVTDRLVSIVQRYYPAFHSIVCLKNSDTFCITETLRAVETSVVPVTINNIPVLNDLWQRGRIPANVTCSDCEKETFNIITRDYPRPPITTDLNAAFSEQCGAAFVDGNTPSGISQSASTTGPGSNNSAAGVGSFSLLVVGPSVAMAGLAAFVL